VQGVFCELVLQWCLLSEGAGSAVLWSLCRARLLFVEIAVSASYFRHIPRKAIAE
jgi:hypothetical protein